MFESICIARDNLIGRSLDFGQLAESLVFYQQVHLLTDHEVFPSLIRTCGTDVVLELCQMGNLKIHYAENMTGVASLDISTAAARHGLVTIKTQNLKYQNQATQFFEDYCGPSGKGFRKTVKRFAGFVQPFDHSRAALKNLESDLTNREYINSCVSSVLKSLAPEYRQPTPLLFDVSRGADDYLRINTNANFVEANASFHLRIDPKDASLSGPFLLAALVSARSHLDFASEVSSDLAFGPLSSVIGANKIATLFKVRETNQEALDRFSEVVVTNSRAIAQAVNSRQRTFLDVLALVHKAEKFKEWLKKQDSSADLDAEYCREVSRIDWADKLPPKSLRWLMVNVGALLIGGAVSPAAGALVGLGFAAADTFILDKMLKGWRPNQFIEGPLKDFISSG